MRLLTRAGLVSFCVLILATVTVLFASVAEAETPPPTAPTFDPSKPFSALDQAWEISCRTYLDGGLGGGPDRKCWFTIHITGDIDDHQLQISTQTISYKHDVETALKVKMNLNVIINSLGGNPTVAMQIGRLIRKDNGNIIIDKNKDCLSSCIFVLIGAIERHWNGGRIGIHRLYLNPDVNNANTTPNSSEIKTTINKLVAEAIAYVDEMNVPRRIIDDMMAIPSDDIKMLSADDLLHYGVLPLDPYVQEAREIAKAKTMGISHFEYLSRRKHAREACGVADNPYMRYIFYDFNECFTHIMNGPPPFP
jgi:hypothetical protein